MQFFVSKICKLKHFSSSIKSKQKRIKNKTLNKLKNKNNSKALNKDNNKKRERDREKHEPLVKAIWRKQPRLQT